MQSNGISKLCVPSSPTYKSLKFAFSYRSSAFIDYWNEAVPKKSGERHLKCDSSYIIK